MNTYRKTSIYVGIFFILSTLTGVLSVFAYGDILQSTDYLTEFSANKTRIVIGTILELMCAAAFVLIAVNAYPVMKRFSGPIATGYVVGRSFEAIPFITSVICLLSLVSISQEFTAAGGNNETLLAAGSALQAMRHWANMLGPLVFCGVAAFPFYTLLVKTRLVPGWIGWWGLVATFPYFCAGLASLFGFDTTSAPAILMIAPFAINEMVLAVYLIIKGFNQDALESVN